MTRLPIPESEQVLSLYRQYQVDSLYLDPMSKLFRLPLEQRWMIYLRQYQ